MPNYPYKDMQQTIYGTEEPMRPPRKEGPLQSTVNPEVFYGEQVGSEIHPKVGFSYDDVRAAIDVLDESGIFVDWGTKWGDDDTEVPPPGVILVVDSFIHDEQFPAECQVFEATGCEIVYSDEYVWIDDEDAVYRVSDAYGFSNVQWSPEHDWLTPKSPIENWIEWAIEHHVDGPRHVTRSIGPDLIGEGFHEIDPMTYGEWEDKHDWGTKGFLEAIHERYGNDVDVVLEHSWINQRGVYWRRNTDGKENGLCARCATAIENDDFSGFDNEPDGSPGRAERFLKVFLDQWGNVTVERDLDPENAELRRNCMGCMEPAEELFWFTPDETREDNQ